MAGKKGKSGRTPKPTALHVVDGTYRPDRHGDRLDGKDRPQPASGATCPAWLSDDAKEVWSEFAPELERLNLLTTLDAPLFAALCLCVAELRWATKQQSRICHNKRTGGTRAHPSLPHRLAAIEKLKGLCSEFGMSPAARARVEAVALGGNSSPAPEGGSEPARRKVVTDRLGRPC